MESDSEKRISEGDMVKDAVIHVEEPEPGRNVNAHIIELYTDDSFLNSLNYQESARQTIERFLRVFDLEEFLLFIFIITALAVMILNIHWDSVIQKDDSFNQSIIEENNILTDQ